MIRFSEKLSKIGPQLPNYLLKKRLHLNGRVSIKVPTIVNRTQSEVLRDHLEETFHSKIPITRAMGIRVLRYDGTSLVLGAPLAANVNDKGTAFGGSIYSLLVLSGWGLLQIKLQEEDINGDIMIYESSVSYSQPITADWEAHCRLPGGKEYASFLEKLRTGGRARLALESLIMTDSGPAVSFQGSYAVVVR